MAQLLSKGRDFLHSVSHDDEEEPSLALCRFYIDDLILFATHENTYRITFCLFHGFFWFTLVWLQLKETWSPSMSSALNSNFPMIWWVVKKDFPNAEMCCVVSVLIKTMLLDFLQWFKTRFRPRWLYMKSARRSALPPHATQKDTD